MWKVVSFIQLNAFLSASGYSIFLALFYIFVGLLAVNFALAVWGAHSFSNNRFEVVWPIQFLRWFGLIFYQVLDIASLTLLLVTLDCNYFDVPDSIRFHNQEFPDVMCWSMPHIIHVGVSVASIVLFYVMATAMVVSEVELNPLTHNYMAMAHTRVEGIAFTIKVIATIASVMVSSVKWLSIVYLLCFTTLLYLHVKWVPFSYSTLNYVRCGSYATVLYCSVILVALEFERSGDAAVDDARRKMMTLVLWIGMAPAAIAGAAACHLRLRHFNRYVLGRFRDADPSVKSKIIYRFDDAREVEIAARCCQSWIDEDTPAPEAVAMTEQIIKAGMIQLPQDPYMVVLYSSFLIDTAKKQSPGLLERFAIFIREQEHTQKANGATGGDSTVDMVAYVEFQRNCRLVVRAHREALIAMRSFWGLLLHHEIDFNHLSRALRRIEITVKAAERAYRGVLARHGSSARLVRLYGKFLESIKFDPWAAAKWYTEADRLDEDAEHTKEALQLGGLETLLPGRGANLSGITDIEGVAIICINAQSLIQVASPEAHALLGYSKNELEGKDVGIIMPPPFGERHAAYVRNYVTTGFASVLDRPQEFLALTKAKQVVPIRLCISKVSGLNEDSLFLAILEPTQPAPDEARAWVLGNGSIIAADDRFCDWLGYELTDLVGTAVEDAVVEKSTMRDLAAAWPLLGSLPRTAWRHKYSEPLPFDTLIQPGAFGSMKVHAVVLRRCAAPPDVLSHGPSGYVPQSPRYWDLMLVSNHAGQIQHATAALAQALGRTPDSIRSGGLGMLIPEPFNMLHGPWWQELANPQSIHPGPTSKPFRLSVQQRLVGGDGSKLHVVMMEQLSDEEALSERRLCLTLDLSGTVVSAEAAPNALFDVEPEGFCGRSIASVVDLFTPHALEELLANGPAGPFAAPLAGPYGALGKGASLDGLDVLSEALGGGPAGQSFSRRDPASDGDRVTRALLELAGRSADAPGCSWRVGVMVPPDAAALADLEELSTLLGPADRQAAAELMGSRTIPAVMRVRLVRKPCPVAVPAGQRNRPSADSSQAPLSLMALGGPAGSNSVEWGAEAVAETIEELAAAGLPRCGPGPVAEAAEADEPPLVTLDAADLAAMDELAVSPGSFARRSLQSQVPSQRQKQDSVVLSGSIRKDMPPASPQHQLSRLGLVELWRADQLSGVLEVDHQGKVLRADSTCLLGQSGLVLGAATSTLLGCSVADLLPLPPGGVEALFDPITAAGGFAGPSDAPRGALKQRKSTKRKVGEPVVMTVRHRSDGCAMELRVQAMRRSGPMGSAYLLLHPASPATAQPGFARWLYGGDTSGLMAEKQGGRTSRRSTVQGMSSRRITLQGIAGTRTTAQCLAAAGGDGRSQTATRQASFAATTVGFDGVAADPHTALLASTTPLAQAVPVAAAEAPEGLTGSGPIVPRLALEASFDPTQSRVAAMSFLLDGTEQRSGPVADMAVGSPRQTAILVLTAADLDAEPPAVTPRKKSDMVTNWVMSEGRDRDAADDKDVPDVSIFPPQHVSNTAAGNSPRHSADHSGSASSEADRMSSLEERRSAEAEGEGASVNEGGTTATNVEVESEAGAHVANYGAGKRFKKLLRILTSPMAQQPARMLRLHAMVLLALMLVAHAVTFVLLLTKLRTQKDAITDLNSVTMASRRIHEIAINGRLLESLYTGDSYVEGLTQFGDPVDETLAGVYDDTSRVMILLKEEHHGVYLGFRALRRIPTDFGLRDIWDNPTLNITLFFDENDPAAPEHILHQAADGLPTSYSMMGLWDAGNLYLAKSLDLYNNAEAVVAKGINYTTWSTWKFLQTNGLPVIFPAYLSTLDALVQLTVQQSKQIYQLQLVILCIEGGLLCISACTYMWIMADRFSRRRHLLYGVFIQVPIGITRRLASMSLRATGS
ncbi:Tiny macrocysts protein B [Tetrabaena socialis]|uniref:Tiny macrocysts protein B n=1 Tax=Tetrabaena socialis TaxID=47790 RepID=A0A2J8AIC2_9CHLO|nr:Tiny macrocysts protein B [Tetrabaena socialis]|eukprot:PNH12261.1 Tiny macrocysts protein B [Tetrabaena socialis]